MMIKELTQEEDITFVNAPNAAAAATMSLQ